MCGYISVRVSLELMSWRFVSGTSGAAQMTGAQLYLTDISTAENRARTLAPSTISWSIGACLGPAIGGLIAEHFGLCSPFYFVGGALAFVALHSALFIPETCTFTETVNQKSTTQTVTWREVLQNSDIQSIFVLYSCFWLTASGAQFTLLPMLASEVFQLSPGSIGSLFALMAAVNALGAQPAAALSDKIGRKWSLIPGALTVTLAVALLPFASTYAHLVSLLVLWGVGSALVSTSPAAYLADITTDRSRPRGLAILRSGGDLGLMMGAGVLGYVADVYGIPAALATNSALLAAASIFFGMRARETSKDLQKGKKKTHKH